MSNTIEIQNLTKCFGEISAVKNIDFKAEVGEVILILGPNGAGKSTLMNMITGYLAPTCGEIKILGKNIKDDALFAKENIGFLPEGSPIYPDFTVKGFLSYMAELRGVDKKNIANIAKIAQIENILNQKVETLSKGYLRRVGFAQSILSDPPILILDEPTDGLDPNQKSHIRKLICKMGKDKTILISTHLLDEAETIATRIVIINNGEIKADGKLNEILSITKTKNIDEAFKVLTR